MLINYFLILTTLLLVSGLVLDAGLLEWRQLHLQNAADAAAQEGMYEKGRSDTAWATAAQAQATANGFTNGVNGVTVTMANPPTSGSYAGNLNSVQATVSQSVNNLFMGLVVNGGKSTVAATAVASIIPTCIWIMNPSSFGSSSFWLASTGISASCGTYVNTSAGYTYGVDGFASLFSLRNRSVQSSSWNTSSGTVTPPVKYYSASKNDPLAYVTAPIVSTCAYTSTTVNGGTYTVYPGTYCGGMTVSNAVINFYPGLYIIAGGLSISNSTLSGSGVTLYMTKTASETSYGTVLLNNVTANMYAPTTSSSGGIPGVFMFTDRNWVDHGNQDILVKSCTLYTDGIWYLPNVGLNVYNTYFTGYSYLGFVVDNFYQYLGHTYPSANYATLGYISPIHYEDGVLVQ